MTAKRVSMRAAKLRRAELAQARAVVPLLSEPLERTLASYQPTAAGVSDQTWQAIKEAHHEVIRRSQVRNMTTLRNLLGVVAKFLAWRHEQSRSLAYEQAFTATEIDAYYKAGLEASEKTRNDYRSRLRKLASTINPGPDAPVSVPVGAYVAVHPGYSELELSGYRRIALRQRSPGLRRQMCAIVGLGAGAGLDGRDLRFLIRSHIVDHGPDGIEVHVQGSRLRTVWVRRDYEELVRAGIEGLKASQAVVGQKTGRKNVTSNVVDGADYDQLPKLVVARLRSSWLSWLITRPVPVQVVMKAAGLVGTRSLSDLLKYLPDPSADAGLTTRDGEP